MPPVKVICIGGIQIVQSGGQIRAGSFNKKVVMVGHEDIRMNHDAVALVNPFKTANKANKVLLHQKNRPLLVSPRRDVVKTTFPFNSQWSGHNTTASTMSQCLMSRPDTEFFVRATSVFATVPPRVIRMNHGVVLMVQTNL